MTDTPQKNLYLLKQLADRLKDNRSYMAWVLAMYQRIERMDEDHLRTYLGTSLEILVRLATCKCPDPATTDFASQVRAIADYTQLDPVILANMIQQATALDTFTNIPYQQKDQSEWVRGLSPGMLSAARDRAEDDVEDNSSSTDKNDGGDQDAAG